MPTFYGQRKTNRGAWTQENLDKALKDLQKGNVSIREVALNNNIPEKTLRTRLKQNNFIKGRLVRTHVYLPTPAHQSYQSYRRCSTSAWRDPVVSKTRSFQPKHRRFRCFKLQRTFLAFCLFASTMATPTDLTANNLAIRTVSQGAHLFSTNFVKNVAKETSDNLICSPLSANIALSMAANGAVGATEAQFKDVLKLPATKSQTLEGYQNLIDKLNNVENVTLKLANKIFIGKSFPVKPEYKQDLETYYRSDIQSVDFAKGDEAANIVNTWCKEKTNNRIDSIISPADVDPYTALILANAVYFKGKWAHEFDPKATSDRPFHIDANTVKEVPTMYRKGNYKYAELPEYDAKCIELPYANKEVSMVIILPNKIDGLTALTDKLEEVSAECSTRLAQTYEREVRVFLPKFKTESKLNLGDTLSQKMGLDKPFSNSAEFGGISDIPLKISKVVQKAFIEVNEEGSEAAAVTGVVVQAFAFYEVEELEIDHPFVYTIVKTSSKGEKGVREVTPLFFGNVINPEY
ncbi:serine protease inhibitor 3/4-like isoform X6 [Temnothorax nylanderi]|uniref:serine protease inhibitor 3/4-like isoform X6 n=1 Tax=Temnothorax nylanderi TaxID=102681 RepID=UPI003A8589A0